MYTMDLEYLERLPDHVRADYLRIVERMVAVVPSSRGSRLAVPVLWLTLDAAGGQQVTVERVDLTELYRKNGYPDEFHRWQEAAVRSRMAGVRCAALAYHGYMGSSIDSPLIHALSRRVDRNAHLHVIHRDRRLAIRDAFPVQRGPLRRLRFAPEVYERLAKAQRA